MRTICGRGYSGSTFSGDTSFAQRVMRPCSRDLEHATVATVPTSNIDTMTNRVVIVFSLIQEPVVR